MKTYEYAINLFADDKSLEKGLNALGKAGWRVCQLSLTDTEPPKWWVLVEKEEKIPKQ